MAKTIGSLNVSMGLSITDFVSNLDKVKDDLGGLEAITSEASKHFEEDVAGIMGDALHKFAKTSKLGADDALAFAVSLKKLGLDADTITSTLDKFGKGIGKFAKNAGEASKAFAGILGKIGESDKVLLKDIQALESMGVKAFDALAKELSKVEGKAVSTADVMKRIASGSLSGADALKALTSGLTAVAAKITDTNTAEYIANSKTLKGTTDLATKSLELQARQMNVDSGATKQLFEDMKKLEAQEIAIIALENKAKGIVTPPKVDTNTGQYVAGQIKLKSETDMVTKSLELQARQMNVDSGATKQLFEDMKKLEAQELKLIEAENKARGIPPPLPIMPPPIPVNKNTAEYVLNAKKMASETDVLNKSLDLQARQMMIDSGATKQLHEEMKKLEAQEKNLVDAENKAKGIASPVAAKESQAKSKLAAFLNHVEGKIKSAASSIFSSVTNLIMNPVTAIGGALASYGVYKIYDRAVMAFANTEEILTRIKGLAGEANAERLGGVMNEIANQGRIAQDAVGKLATGFLGLGVSGADAARMIESFGRTSLVAGSGATDVFNKLGETVTNMAKTGVASKEDFAALDSMGLPVYEALAQRLTTVMGRAILAKEAIDMLAKGTVKSKDAVNALAGMQNNADVIKQAEAQAGTLKGIYARLAGEVEGFFTQFGGAIVEALDLKGFSQGLIGFMKNLRSNFDSLVPALKNIGMVLAVVRDVLFQAFSGLVNFFTTMGGADVAVGNIDSIRAVVVSFAQAVMVSMQSVMSGAITVINEIINAVGGLKKFAAIFAGVVLGAGGGALAGSAAGGVGAIPGALIGGVTGGLYANSKVDGGGPGIDAEGIKAKMNTAFDEITRRIGGSGVEAGNQFLTELENTIVERSKGFEDKANPFRKFSLAGVDTQIDSFFSSLSAANVGHTTFLNTMQGGIGSTIAILRREMELGNLTAEEFSAKMTKLSEGGMAALDGKLKSGIITNKQYGDAIAIMQEKLDALNESADVKLKIVRPAWLENIVNELTPLEKYKQGIADLNANMANLSPEQLGKGAKFLTDELEKSVGAMEELKNPGALMKGSAAAFSQVLKIQNANGGESAADKLLRIQQQALTQQAAQTALQQQIAAATMNQANMVIAAIN